MVSQIYVALRSTVTHGTVVSMKIHAKMGGVTHQVPQPQLLDNKTMMLGADVRRFAMHSLY